MNVTAEYNPPTKPSGIPWLGEVPAHWEMKKIRFLFRFQSGGTPSTTNEAYWEGSLPWVSAKDMKKMWISDTEDHIAEFALAESAANTVPPNSLLLLTRSGILQHTIPVCVNSRRMAINQDVKGCIPVADNVDVRFCAYFIHGSQEQLLPLWRQEGATVESLEFETVKNTSFALPPLPEQRAIAAFLDERTSRIDGLIARKKRLVQLLMERRQALITRAVTRGLDTNVKLKPSGVTWLGQMPVGWKVKKIKHLARDAKNSFIDGDWIESPVITTSGIRYITTGNVGQGVYKEQGEGFISEETFHELRCTEVFPGDLVFSRLSLPIGRSCIIPDLGHRIITSVDNVIFRPTEEVNKSYLVYQTNMPIYFQFTDLMARGSTLVRISRTMLGEIELIIPPRDVQDDIVRFLDGQTARIDALIKSVDMAVERLQEYRSALISAAVTGKIKVPQEDPQTVGS